MDGGRLVRAERVPRPDWTSWVDPVHEGECGGVSVVPPSRPAPDPAARDPLARFLDRWGAGVAALLCAGLVAFLYGQALGFAFTFDDPLDLPRAEGRSIWSLLSSSEGYAYYRPIPFILWKGFHWLQGGYDRATLHGLTLAAHAGAAWFLYLLLRRLTGAHWGLLAAVLFIAYPFSYQAVFGAHTLFHPLMTAGLLLSLLLYHDARVGTRNAEWGRKAEGRGQKAEGRGRGPEGREQFRSPLPSFLPSALLLAGSVLAAIVALWTHESGVVILPLVIGLELVLASRARAEERAGSVPGLPRQDSAFRVSRFAPHALATAAFVVTWLTVPKVDRPEAFSTASLVPNARFFLQGMIYPVAVQLDVLGARWGFDPARALWPAIVVTLALLFALYALGRQPWWPVLALGAAAIVLVPAWAVLTWAYVEDAPRLLYPAAPAIAALWAGLPALRFGRRGLDLAWRVASGALLVAVVAHSVAFIGVRRDMWAEGTVLLEGVADAAAAHEGRPLLFLNVPAWFAPKRPEYPVGHVGLTTVPGYIGLGRSAYLHRGVEPVIESRSYYPDVNGWKYDFNGHGGPAGFDDFAAILRRVDAAYTVEMLPGGARIRPVGELRPGEAAGALVGPRFDPSPGGGAILTRTAIRLDGDELTGDFMWVVIAPPPGDYVPVLRVRDAGGAVVAEQRAYPLGDIAPPRLWEPGDRVRDRPLLRLPAGLPPGDYTVWLTWEEHTDGAPLGGFAADGAPLPPDGLAVGAFVRPPKSGRTGCKTAWNGI